MGLRNSNEVVFLLGAGASLPAGMPNTDEITKQVLSGKDVFQHSDWQRKFFISPKHTESSIGKMQEPDIQRIVRYVKKLEGEVKCYFQKSGISSPVNYEDIYYVAAQLVEHADKEIENPAVNDFYHRILKEVIRDEGKYLEDSPKTHDLISTGCLQTHIETLARKIINDAPLYIECVVREMLSKDIGIERLDRLVMIEDACCDTENNRVWIGTLNHDLVLDTFFKNRGIAFADGFSEEPKDGVRLWDAKEYDNPKKICLLKLHGAVNWKGFRWDGDNYTESMGIEEKEDHQRRYDYIYYPGMLIGTFNKIMNYSLSRVYTELQRLFLHALNSTRVVVVSGYSFGDKAVNTRLIEWLYGSRDRRLVVVHAEPTQLAFSARGAIGNKWEDWERGGILQIVPKRIEDTRWKDIGSILGK